MIAIVALIASSLIVVYSGVSFFRVGTNGDRGDIWSIPAPLLLRDPADNSAGIGDVGGCGDCSLSSKFPNADAPKNG
jgi:hypothetical protein